MKKLLAAITVLCLAISVNAQKPATGNMHQPMHRMHHRGDMAKQLNFTAEQKEQLKSINKDFHQKLSDLDKKEDITVKEMRDQKASLMKEQRTAFQNLLTTEQKNKLEDLRKQGAAKREAMAAKHLDKMKSTLNLSDDQTAKIKNIDQSFKEQLKKIHEDESLGRVAKKDQLMAVFQQHKKDIENVFTQDQLNKLKELRKDRMDKRM